MLFFSSGPSTRPPNVVDDDDNPTLPNVGENSWSQVTQKLNQGRGERKKVEKLGFARLYILPYELQTRNRPKNSLHFQYSTKNE